MCTLFENQPFFTFADAASLHPLFQQPDSVTKRLFSEAFMPQKGAANRCCAAKKVATESSHRAATEFKNEEIDSEATSDSDETASTALSMTEPLNPETSRSKDLHVDFVPAADVVEDTKQYNIYVSVAGSAANNIRADFNKVNNTLVVKGDVPHIVSGKDTGAKSLHSEIKTGHFERTFEFGHAKINEDGVKAEYENGIICIQVPKVQVVSVPQNPAAKQTVRRIPVVWDESEDW